MIDPLLIPITAITFVLGVPSIALATHFVLRPMVRDVVGAIQANKPRALSEDVDRRLAKLEDGFSQIETQVTRLVEAERFHRQLEAGGEDPRRARPG